MLKLRRGVVASVDPLLVRIGDEERPAWRDPALVGEIEEGDEVVVNVEALDLELGSGGFDVVVVNLSRGLDSERSAGSAVKLNYTPIQHTVDPVEAALDGDAALRPAQRPPVLVLMLHGQLAPAVWAARRGAADLRIGYVQTGGGALPGALSLTVGRLREEGLLDGHMTAGAAYGGEEEAVTVIGALHAAAEVKGWEAVVAGPGPGIIGSATALGHGGMTALDTAHCALALGLPVVLAPRASEGDPRERHRGLSHHTRTVLELLLGEVTVGVPEGAEELRGELEGTGAHSLDPRPVDRRAYAESGLPAETMGRVIEEDALFFDCALAAGASLGALAGKEAE